MEAIIISDIHLGAENCQAKLLVDFLEKIHNGEIITNKLILNGDVFDNFDSRLCKSNWKVLSFIRRIADEIEVIWVRGNHDFDGSALSIAHLIGANYVNEYIFESCGKKILCVHGDIFDNFINNHPILTWIADNFYIFSQRISIKFSKKIKHSSKTFLRCAEKIKQESLKYKSKKNCDFVCCGHSHLAAAEGDYYNSGCWTELPPTYLEVNSGEIKLKTYDKHK